MTKQPLENPTGHAVAQFAELRLAEAARDSLTDEGFAAADVRLIHGETAAENIDASLQWFADTDEALERLKQAVAAGESLLAVAVENREQLADVERICRGSGGEKLIHFGQWVVEEKAI